MENMGKNLYNSVLVIFKFSLHELTPNPLSNP
jgi:hypothetical protein